MPTNDFAHLHVHTQYSLLDGTPKIPALLDRAKELGFSSVAITDHGVMYGAVEFYTEAKKRGIKPIIGCEVYTANGSRHSRTGGVQSSYGHLVLLCKNDTGYKNLMSLVSYAFTEGYYYKPRVDMELLRKYSDGLIALSGCLKGDVSASLVLGNYELAKKKALELNRIFGDGNFYLEIQDHGIEDEKKVIEGMILLSKETAIPLAATNDVHYTDREDSLLQDVVTCIQTGKRLDDTDRLKFFGSEFYLKSKDEMQSLFSYIPEALSNTIKIADKCNLNIDFDSLHLPKIEIQTNLTHFEYLKNLCFEGAKKKYKEVTDEITERINYELGVIESMSYTDYFLIVWDFIKFAKDSGIPIGPGRGSAAGSIVSYTLNITDIDPLKYDLLFERFLNPERVTMPDIDIDICNERRDEVKDYVVKKYGEQKVASIITFGTMAARAAVRDVGRVLGIDPSIVDKTAKSIPEGVNVKLIDALKNDRNLKNMYDTVPDVKRLIDLALKAEGLVRHASTHAAGVVISDSDLFNYVPVQTADKGVITQYPMASLEKIGLLKMDFLGLRNLTIIDNTVKLVKETLGIEIDIYNLDYEDEKTYKLIKSGDTDGVFQLENPGLKAFLRKFKPSKLEDIIATTSIYRPGPMEQIPRFLKNYNNPQSIKYLHPSLEPILSKTYGTIIYQEQVMNIVRTLAGYSMGRADLVRRAMAKKKQTEMAKEREVFINGLCDENGKVLVNGTRRNGIDDVTANKVFDLLSDFANYAFNKSHAACYATVAYQTAYLKANYPTQYLVSLLASLVGNSSKTFKYVTGFSKYGIKLLPPDINKSSGYFTAEGKNVRFGLSAIKNVGMTFPRDIEKEREAGGEFRSFADFLSRMCAYDINKRSVEVLIKCGAFDSLFKNRRVLLMNYELMLDSVQKDTFNKSKGQVSFFTNDSEDVSLVNPDENSYPDFTPLEKYAFENELSGMYLSGNPMREYLMHSAFLSDALLYSINDGEIADGARVNVCGVISKVTTTRTKRGVFICTLSFSDFFATMEVTAFENVYSKYQNLLTEGKAVLLTATVRKREDQTSLNVVSVRNLDEIFLPKEKKLYLRLSDRQMMGDISRILSEYKGEIPVYLYFEDTGDRLMSDKNNGIELTNELTEKLFELLGGENVKIK